MALVDLKSNLANYRADFTTPSPQPPYGGGTPLPPAPPLRDSQYNIDSEPVRYTPKEIKTFQLSTFNVGLLPPAPAPRDSQYNIDTVPEKYTPKKLTYIESTPNKFSSQGKYVPSSYDNELFKIKPSDLRWRGNVPPAVNFFDDSRGGALGFTTNMFPISGPKKKTQFFTDEVEKQYVKHNLQDDSTNYTYIKHPLILRGIQRKDKPESQRWGTDALTNFDDGLVRGGMTTVIDRAAADTVRIAKWMASPKGLLWVIKQVGLGLSNPNVEKSLVSTLLGVQQTKVHTGLASLLSVPGTPLGLHFTRHGIPFLNEKSTYGAVIKFNQLNTGADYESNNRLVKVKRELFGEGIIGSLLNTASAFVPKIGLPILALSTPVAGIGGPNSVYGIGGTRINRYVDTVTDAISRAKYSNFEPVYDVTRQYASVESNAFNKTSADSDTNKNTIKNVDSQSDLNIGERTSLNTRIQEYSDSGRSTNITPGSDGKSLETNTTRVSSYPDSPSNPINDYATLAYSKIPKDRKSFRDFRADIDNTMDGRTLSQAGMLGTGLDDKYYEKNNLETRYGFGKLGEVGADRTNPYQFLATGQEFGKRENRTILLTDQFRGDRVNALDVVHDGIAYNDIYPDNAKDLIKFYLQDGDMSADKDINKSVMVFRATITGFTDSFNPSWDRIDIMGRPDGAYLYTSFERNISFNFLVAATSRSEMIPMWRKLNYLASYTMPDFDAKNKPSGPFMRITLGDLFQQTPGFISSLSYTVPDDATWDIADDANNDDAKQLPMMVDVSVSFTIVGDYRPQMLGRVYSLSPRGTKQNKPGQWLIDSAIGTGSMGTRR